MLKNILVVEDDREIRELLKGFLVEKGYKLAEAENGKVASELIEKERFDIILMDMMLPYKSGDVLIKELRSSQDVQKRKTPVIVLSAKTMMDTRLEVLRMGADDYIIKPFDLNEVLVRIEVVLRRSEGTELSSNSESAVVYSHKGIELNTELNTVTYNGEMLKLTSKELQLLELFFKNPLKTFTKANLYEAVWNDTYIYEDNTINVHMSNLRSKLKKATGEEYIETVWGIGYKLKQ